MLRIKEASVIGYVSTLLRIQSAFERTGLRFHEHDVGARLA